MSRLLEAKLTIYAISPITVVVAVANPHEVGSWFGEGKTIAEACDSFVDMHEGTLGLNFFFKELWVVSGLLITHNWHFPEEKHVSVQMRKKAMVCVMLAHLGEPYL